MRKERELDSSRGKVQQQSLGWSAAKRGSGKSGKVESAKPKVCSSFGSGGGKVSFFIVVAKVVSSILLPRGLSLVGEVIH